MGLAISKDLIIYPKQDDIEWSKPDRQPNVMYGYNKDRKCKVVKIGMQTPEVPTGLITLKQDSKKPVEFEMKSFTRNYYNRLTEQFMSVACNVLGTTGGAGYLNIRKTSGAWDTTASHYITASSAAESQILACWSNALGGTTAGMLIGSGSGAFSFEDYVPSGYTHGYSSGNIFHTSNTPYVISYDAGTRVWTVNHSRFFDNFSGGTISNINELALVMRDDNTFLYLEERSVLGSPITLLNKEGLRVRYQREYTFPASVDWTRNAYNTWFIMSMVAGIPDSTFGAGLRSVKDTGGTVRFTSITSGSVGVIVSSSYGYNEGANLSTYGIQVGTVNTAESLEDFSLTGKVAHSAAFTYDANTRLTTTYTAGTKTYLTQWSRQVNNISSGDTIIAEIGLIAYLSLSGLYKCLFARKVLASPVTLTNTESMQVIYEISSIYPA